jgi:hypothetical protein
MRWGFGNRTIFNTLSSGKLDLTGLLRTSSVKVTVWFHGISKTKMAFS